MIESIGWPSEGGLLLNVNSKISILITVVIVYFFDGFDHGDDFYCSSVVSYHEIK